MDSKSLYDLYKPLWEEVPETRPRLIRPDEGGAFLLAPLEHFNGWEYVRDDGIVRCGFLEPEDGADRCRVAVEDWLVTHGRLGERGNDWFSIGTILDGVPGHYINDQNDNYHTGPTIHHALVAAALAVAKARKDAQA